LIVTEMWRWVRSSGRTTSKGHLARVPDNFTDLKASPRKKAGDLSVGQRNLLGLARGLMLDPKAILVDKPTAGLAPAAYGEFVDQPEADRARRILGP
jgi:ABC-type branched-subunit amino acid transport system ATPase component